MEHESLAVVAMEALHTAAAEATSALVVYFAGHGLLDVKGDLYLVPGGADRERIYRGIHYEDVRRELLYTANCPAKVARNRRGPSTRPEPEPDPVRPERPRPPAPRIPVPRPAAPMTKELPRPVRIAAEAADLRAAGRHTDADALLVRAST
ncbi:hypothetical protein AB0K00_44525 [Dactylosporangium sp. NPDC049525]|uniref:hypothetical protein n=1 Tax=Dactylosporangium sp. NPDC049525 TaxID=3154730 RepID=UPI0034189405